MPNKRGNQVESSALPVTNTDEDPIANNPELDKLGARLQAHIPDNIVSLTFRDTLKSKILDVQANEKTKG